MKKIKKFRLYILILLLACALTNLATVLIMAYGSQSDTASAPQEQAYLKITVLDINTKLPIKDATVCIPETQKYYSTDQSGRTSVIPVPYLKNSQYDNINQRDWGDITILAYKDGYSDYLIFYIMVTKDRTRYLTLTLVPYTGDSEPILLIESPDNEWAKEIIEKYKK